MRKLLLFVTLGCLMLLPSLAFASGGVLPSTEGNPLTNLIKVTIGAGLSWLFGEVVGWVRQRKAGAAVLKQLDVHQLEQMIADEAIDYAEEQAHKAVKRAKEILTPLEKAAAARGYAEELAKARKLAKDSIGRVTKIIEARLNAKRREPETGAMLRLARSR